MKKTTKIGIIGAGHVGSHVASSLMTQGLCDEIVLLDTDEGKARRHADVKECYPFGQTHHLIAGEGFDAGRFVRETTARGFRRVTLRPVGAGIEDVFIKLMRHA